MPEHLPHTITPVDPAELARALLTAWRDLFGQPPTRAAILTLMAQSAHETGHWRAVHNFNIGNVKSREGDGRDYTNFRCRERENGADVWYDPPHPATRFRAFRTLREGVADHLAFLKGSKRYGKAWEALEHGRPYEFAAQLRAGGYYTDPVEVYARGLLRFFDEFDHAIPLMLVPHADELDDETKARTVAALARSSFELRAEVDDAARADTEPAPPKKSEPPGVA
jgi:hypothetical protein